MLPSMKLTSARTVRFLAISALLAPASALAQQAQAEPQAPATEQAAAPSSATELDAVEVRGEYIPEPMLASPAIMTHVSKQDLERQGDSTAADALARVAGLSVNQGKYGYVRGLNERYSSALLNNSPLPSPEPLTRVVTRTLFPPHAPQTNEVKKKERNRAPK